MEGFFLKLGFCQKVRLYPLVFSQKRGISYFWPKAKNPLAFGKSKGFVENPCSFAPKNKTYPLLFYNTEIFPRILIFGQKLRLYSVLCGKKQELFENLLLVKKARKATPLEIIRKMYVYKSRPGYG